MAKQYGMQESCPPGDYLEHFHDVDGFPPDILHDFLKVLSLLSCAFALSMKKCFSHLTLNNAIKEFPYVHSDKTNQPQLIYKAFHTKGTNGGNGHENWTLMEVNLSHQHLNFICH